MERLAIENSGSAEMIGIFQVDQGYGCCALVFCSGSSEATGV
jgi:hypothetical protein